MASAAFRLEGNGIAISMDSRGRTLDDIFIERLWRSVKQEYVYLNPCETGDELWRGLGTDSSAYTTTGGFTRALDTRHPQVAISSKKRRLDA